MLFVLREGLFPTAPPNFLSEKLIMALEVCMSRAGQSTVESPERGVVPAPPGFLFENDLGGTFNTAVVDALFLEFSAEQVCQPDAAYAGASVMGAMTSLRPGIVDGETEFLKKLIKGILIVRPEGNVLKLQSLSSRFEKRLKIAPEVE